MKPRTVEETRLMNARRLAREGGGVTAMATKLGKSQSLMQNYIGKTPTKNIGSDVAREIEDAYGHPHGYLDMPWDMLEKDSASTAAMPVEVPESVHAKNDVVALQLALESVVLAMTVNRPDVASVFESDLRERARKADNFSVEAALLGRLVDIAEAARPGAASVGRVVPHRASAGRTKS